EPSCISTAANSWMTVQSEVIHFAFIEAQKIASSNLVLVWVTIMDGCSAFTGRLYAVKDFYGFEWRLFFATRVLVLSRMGSHTLGCEPSFSISSPRMRQNA